MLATPPIAHCLSAPQVGAAAVPEALMEPVIDADMDAAPIDCVPVTVALAASEMSCVQVSLEGIE